MPNDTLHPGIKPQIFHMLQLLSRSYPLYLNHIICEVCTASSETEFAASLEWPFTLIRKACGDLLTLTNC